MTSVSWPENHSKKLAEFVVGGEKSYAQIAEALNAEFGTEYSRNSCIGRAGRMGLSNPFQIKTAKKEPAPPLAKRARLVRANSNSTALRLIHVNEPTSPSGLRCVDVIPRGLTLLELQPGECRFPSGEGSEITFCGHSILASFSYCAPHRALTQHKPHNISEAEHERRRRRFMGLLKRSNSPRSMGVPS